MHSKEAKEYVKSELSQHMQQSKQSWVKRGYSEVEAEKKAVKEMGSPLTLGKSLNKLHKPKIDWMLVILLSVTLLLSFLPILALDKGMYLEITNFTLPTMLQNKTISIIIGFSIAIGFMFIDYRKLKRYGYLFYGVGVGLLIAISQFANKIINGESIISLGIIDVQAWVAIPFLLMAWASFFSNSAFKLWKGIALYVFSIYFLLFIPSLSMIFIYSVFVAVLFLKSRFSLKEKICTVGAVILIVIGVVFYHIIAFRNGSLANYQISRILGFISPNKYADESGYIYVTLENAMKSAGLFGAENLMNLPDPHTNLVLGNIIQTYGFLAGIVLFAILSIFLIRFWLISRAIKDPFGKLLTIGGVTLFATQFLYSVAMNFGLVPVSTMSLPFMSYGIMPTVLNAFIVGIVLSVYRRKHFIPLKEDYQAS
nr:FtsW/RodA/SpoVE family cell cycle protein [Ureibacillus chungkukjangi]